jgi:metal-responsive CopG/Arc/MetJ family transcriptional regulator
MATVNFSVPDEVKRAFNEAFSRQNKSAVIAELMREAVEAKRRQERRAAAIEGLLELRKEVPPMSAAEVQKLRLSLRP